ncbi:hypothetical protein [Streptomyces longispororuber]|uniref:hypothetical protein n=1 Tax=Streptomyces longispororuber TaxID=68230 RepID=UPI0036F74745
MSVPPGPMGPLSREYHDAQRAFAKWLDTQATRIVSDIKKGLVDPEAKGEVSAAKVEGVGAAAGIKLVGFERTLLDLNKMLDTYLLARKGLTPEQLKARVDALEGQVNRQVTDLRNRSALLRRSLTRTMLRAQRDRQATAAVRATAEQALRTARTGVRKADAALRQRHTAPRAAGRARGPAQRVDVGGVEQTTRALRELERRVDGLARALG